MLDLADSVHALAQPAGLGIDRLGQGDHRVVRRLDRRRPALVELLAHGHVLDLGPGDQLVGALAGRLPGQDELRHRVVAA